MRAGSIPAVRSNSCILLVSWSPFPRVSSSFSFPGHQLSAAAWKDTLDGHGGRICICLQNRQPLAGIKPGPRSSHASPAKGAKREGSPHFRFFPYL